MYKIPKYNRSKITSVETKEGEPIELKVERIVSQNEPIKDGAPEIFTAREQGVMSAYNIRTDRWEIAAEAMDSISRGKIAQREAKAKLEVVKDKDDKVEPIQGKDAEN